MLPGFVEGDCVLTFNWGFPHIGEVVVFSEQAGYLIKRIKKASNGMFYARGENFQESKRVWIISRGQIVGKVIYKY